MARLATKSPGKTQRVVPETPRTSRRQPCQTPRHSDRPDSLLLPLKSLKLESGDDSETTAHSTRSKTTSPRKTPKRASKKAVNYEISDNESHRRRWPEDDSANDLSDFVVPDSASEDELRRPPRSMRKEGAKTVQPIEKEGMRTPRRLFRKKDLIRRDSDERSDDAEDSVAEDTCNSTEGQPADEKTPGARPLQTKSINLQPWPVLDPFEKSPEKPEPSSPTKTSRKPSGEVRFVTPPTSPSKPKLRSPTKSAARIPPSPHRPSVDAFWSQDVINAWNDEYSPRKTPTARRILSSSDEDDGYHSPTESRRSPTKSPTKSLKKDKALVEQRKRFDAEKHALAAAFLTELDDTITDGQLAALAASTGGVRIVWSAKLLSTAGRANWKRETIRARPSSSPSKRTSDSSDAPSSAPPPPPPPTIRHHAHVELATKVITDADRLRNVLAHEFCHLAAFMLSEGARDAPHGRAFRGWAARVTDALAHRNIAVTTRHAYEIDYAYAWRCEGCGVEVQRHSRSVDPARQRCGTCRGVLVQVRPAPRTPRKGKVGGEEGGSRYQAFVKRWYKEVKWENEGWSMGQVMAELARRYRAEKEKEQLKGKNESAGDEDGAIVREKKESVEGDAVAEVEEVTVLESDEEGPVEDEEPDALERGLKALSLGGVKA